MKTGKLVREAVHSVKRRASVNVCLQAVLSKLLSNTIFSQSNHLLYYKKQLEV